MAFLLKLAALSSFGRKCRDDALARITAVVLGSSLSPCLGAAPRCAGLTWHGDMGTAGLSPCGCCCTVSGDRLEGLACRQRG